MRLTSGRLGIVVISMVGLSAVASGVPSALTAQTAETSEVAEPIVIGERVSIHSAVLDEDRPLLIYTPPGYEQSADRFPVLYLLDANDHFHHTTGVTQFLSANNRMPAMIDWERPLPGVVPETVRPTALPAIQSHH